MKKKATNTGFLILLAMFSIQLFGQNLKDLQEKKINKFWSNFIIDDSYFKDLSNKSPIVVQHNSLYYRSKVKYSLMLAFHYAHNCDFQNAIDYRESSFCILQSNNLINPTEWQAIMDAGYQSMYQRLYEGLKEGGKFVTACINKKGDKKIGDIKGDWIIDTPCQGDDIEVKVFKTNLDINMNITIPIKFKQCGNVKTVADMSRSKFGKGHLGHKEVYTKIYDFIYKIMDKNNIGGSEVIMEISGHADGYAFKEERKYPYNNLFIKKGKKYTFFDQEGEKDTMTLQKDISLYINNNKHLALARACLAEKYLKNLTSNEIQISAYHHKEEDEEGTFRKIEVKLVFQNALKNFFKEEMKKIEKKNKPFSNNEPDISFRCKDVFNTN